MIYSLVSPLTSISKRPLSGGVAAAHPGDPSASGPVSPGVLVVSSESLLVSLGSELLGVPELEFAVVSGALEVVERISGPDDVATLDDGVVLVLRPDELVLVELDVLCVVELAPPCSVESVVLDELVEGSPVACSPQPVTMVATPRMALLCHDLESNERGGRAG